MKKIAVLLSGCGVRDGSEIHEATLALLWIVKSRCEPVFLAPNEPQKDVIDHRTDNPVNESRNCLTEAARIARGDIRDISEMRAADFDALILPGGSGAVKNLLTADGSKTKPEVARLLGETHKAGKPIGAICIAPLVVAKAFEEMGVSLTLTIGSDAAVARQIQSCGHRHVNCGAGDAIIDRKNKIASTPAYMLAKDIGEVEAGVKKLVTAVVEMMR